MVLALMKYDQQILEITNKTSRIEKNMRNRRSILMLNGIYKVSLKICPLPLILMIFKRFEFLIKIDL